MSILAFCGSLRRLSMNAALLRATARLAPAGLTVEIFTALSALPPFNPDLEVELPSAVRTLREILTTMSAHIVAGACLALPLRGLNLTEQQIFESQYAAAIRQALLTLVSQEVRA